MTLKLRKAAREDALALLELYLHLSQDNHPISEAEAQKILSDIELYPNSAVLVGEVEKQIVASVTIIVIPNLTRSGRPYAIIENVVTHKDHRRNGYASILLDAASERAWTHGCYKIVLTTGSKSPQTLAFYGRAGFEQSRTGFQKRNVPPRLEQNG